MITENGISLQEPSIYIRWGTPRDRLIRELAPLGLCDAPGTDVIYFRNDIIISPGLSGSFAMCHFLPTYKGLYGARLHPSYDSGTPDLKEKFKQIQTILISLLGEPTESYPEYGIDNERFDGFKWVIGKLEVYHDITERHGADHCLKMIKKI